MLCGELYHAGQRVVELLAYSDDEVLVSEDGAQIEPIARPWFEEWYKPVWGAK